MGKNYYELLGVSRDADPSTIKARFNELVSSLREDQSLSEFEKRGRERRLTDALNTLSDPYRKSTYDTIFRRAMGNGESSYKARDSTSSSVESNSKPVRKWTELGTVLVIIMMIAAFTPVAVKITATIIGHGILAALLGATCAIAISIALLKTWDLIGNRAAIRACFVAGALSMWAAAGLVAHGLSESMGKWWEAGTPVESTDKNKNGDIYSAKERAVDVAIKFIDNDCAGIPEPTKLELANKMAERYLSGSAPTSVSQLSEDEIKLADCATLKRQGMAVTWQSVDSYINESTLPPGLSPSPPSVDAAPIYYSSNEATRPMQVPEPIYSEPPTYRTDPIQFDEAQPYSPPAPSRTIYADTRGREVMDARPAGPNAYWDNDGQYHPTFDRGDGVQQTYKRPIDEFNRMGNALKEQ